MESKTKQRILGFSVIIGLALLLYVFFQPGKETGTATIVKAPPFPEQTAQVTEPLINEGASLAPVPNQDMAIAPQDNPAVTETAPEPESVLTTVRPSVINAEQKDSSKPEVNNPEVDITNAYSQENTEGPGISHITMTDHTSTTVPPTKLDDVKEKKVAQIEKAKKAKASTSKSVNAIQVSKNEPTTALEDDGLFKLTNAAWVIQIGSFKNKQNALKLVNQLRGKGFKAFIQQVSTTLGDSTRVFVGPEIKHGAAKYVANRIEKELHIRGIVISYKPLTL